MHKFKGPATGPIKRGQTLLAEALIDSLGELFATVGDPRNGHNKQYRFRDILMAAFSAFFVQSPSFLDHQRAFHRVNGKNACGSLFGVEQLPTDTHIRKQLDRIECTEIYDGFDIALDKLKQFQRLRPFTVLGNHTLIALDGTEFHNSRKIHCNQCQWRVKNKDTEDEYTEYYHSVLAAVLVGPDHPFAVPLRPEFISPQDGDKKQDCETKAAYRWFDENAKRYSDLNPLYLGDDLYAKQPMCEKVIESGAQFIFRVKVNDHKTLFDYLNGINWPNRTVLKRTPGRKSPNKEFHYRWTNYKLPLTAQKDALEVYYAELCIKSVGSKSKGSVFRFITSIKPTADTVAEIVACGRARWRCENEGFNLLKNQGYHLEHSFGHGDNGLANTLLTLNLIAFAFHGACDQLCALWYKARQRCSRRKRFFYTMDVLTEWWYFANWYDLLIQIAYPEARPIAKAFSPP